MRPHFLRNFAIPPFNADVLYEWQALKTLVHKYQYGLFAINRSAKKNNLPTFLLPSKECVLLMLDVLRIRSCIK